MTGRAEVTIVIPVKNRAHLISRTLDSVSRQSLRPLRVIVVDNASTDSTADVVKEIINSNKDDELDIRLLSESCPGAAAARQRGLENVKTEYVYFFDSDDVLRQDALRDLLTAIKRNPASDLAIAPLLFHEISGKSIILGGGNKNPMCRHFNNTLLYTPSYLARTAFINDAGGWNVELRIWDDWELGIRLLLKNPAITCIENVVADIYQQQGSVTGDSYSSRHQYYPAVLDAVRKSVEMSDYSDKRKLVRMTQYRRMMLAAHYKKEGNASLAREEYDKVIRENIGDRRLCCWLRLCYKYISRGGRGASRLMWRIM